MTKKQIEAIGHFLAYYYTDLLYISQFQSYIGGKISEIDYVSKTKGSFYSFLIEFRIVRNFQGGQALRLLEETSNFVRLSDCRDVDGFALQLSQTEFTRNNILASLASKILFLNDPGLIIPMDSRARKTLGQNVNRYNVYSQNLSIYTMQNENTIREMLDYVKPMTDIIHKEFPLLKNIELIKKNRMIDKLLWTAGK